MSHHYINRLSDYDSSGPRPPIPGQEETRKFKMTDAAQNELHLFMTSSSSSQSSSSPSCLKWARTLSSLLEDRDGVELFKKYVEQEGGIHSDRLNFYFACEGLKQQSDGEKVKQIIGAIYRFLKKSQLAVPEEMRAIIKAGLKDKNFVLTPDLFDQMQQDVERIINETTYRNFLQSETYLHYVQNYQSAIERNEPTATTLTTTVTSTSISEASSKIFLLSSALPTLHEEGDGLNVDGSDSGAAVCFGEANNSVPAMSGASTSGKVPMSLTKDALLQTQRRRLEMRPPGSHGYSAYNNYASYNHSSYNPVSRRDSELASLSSGRTDSDTMSISSMSTDGRPQRRHHHHHQQLSIERKYMRESAACNNEKEQVIPRTRAFDPKLHYLSEDEFLQQLIPKLELLRKEQESKELLKSKGFEADAQKSNKIFADAINAKFILIDDKDDQEILDEHVSRVWSDMTPHRSPGNASPCNQFQRKKPHEMVFVPGGSTQSSMRTSKSMPDSNMRKYPKWGGSVNTDSGISLVSSDTMRHKDGAMSISGSSSSSMTRPRTQMLPPEVIPSASQGKMSQQLEDVQRSKRYQQQPPLPQKNVVPPPLPAKNFSQPSAPSTSAAHEPTTTVVYSFCDEDVPYRIKIPGRHPPTLKQFKDYLPKKGNYRFFFKTRCDDDDNPIIQEEMCNDSDVLPLFEGKVMATVKSAN